MEEKCGNLGANFTTDSQAHREKKNIVVYHRIYLVDGSAMLLVGSAASFGWANATWRLVGTFTVEQLLQTNEPL
jgi:hypothetical protein